MVPPPEEGRRQVDRRAHQFEPGRPELRLEAEPPCGPLRRRPHGREHDREDDEDLTPEDLGCGQGLPPSMIWGQIEMSLIAIGQAAESASSQLWIARRVERGTANLDELDHLHERTESMPSTRCVGAQQGQGDIQLDSRWRCFLTFAPDLFGRRNAVPREGTEIIRIEWCRRAQWCSGFFASIWPHVAGRLFQALPKLLRNSRCRRDAPR